MRHLLAAITSSLALPVIIVLLVLKPLNALASESLHGFDLQQTLIPAGQILPGGPPRDGIPALSQAHFINAEEARTELQDDDRILALLIEGQARAYPVAILNWHEIVNDSVGNTAVAITYCPLCGSGVAFSRQLQGKVLDFGVSGLLYNNDVLLYDRQTESLWSQILGQAISGPAMGSHLQRLPLEHTRWKDWRLRHPETQVLSRKTGYRRDYNRDPYADYRRSRRIIFPLSNRTSNRLHPKEEVLTVTINGQHKAWPFSELAKSPSPLMDHLAGQNLRIEYDTENRSASIYTTDQQRLTSMISYWFAWYAFHPDSAVYRYQTENDN